MGRFCAYFLMLLPMISFSVDFITKRKIPDYTPMPAEVADIFAIMFLVGVVACVISEVGSGIADAIRANTKALEKINGKDET